VKRKSPEGGNELKSSLRKRPHQLTETADTFTDNGDIGRSKTLRAQLSDTCFLHTSAATSVDTASVNAVAPSINGSVVFAENKLVSDIVSMSVPYDGQMPSHTVKSSLSGTAIVTSDLTVTPKITEPYNRRIQHLKFSAGTVASSKSVTTRQNQQQTVANTGQQSRMLTNDTSSEQSTITDGIYLFWPNEDSLCWLDAAMAVIVCCESLRGTLAQSSGNLCLSQLLTDFDEAQLNFRRSRKLYRCHYLCGQGKAVTLETSVGQVSVKTGGGHGPQPTSLLGGESTVIASVDLDDISSIVSTDDPHSTSLEKISWEAQRLDDKARRLMSRTRDELFDCLQPRMNCKRGERDSVLVALSEILSLDETVRSHFTVHYTYCLTCTSCGQPESGTYVFHIFQI